jgi:hypothetical protein
MVNDWFVVWRFVVYRWRTANIAWFAEIVKLVIIEESSFKKSSEA